MPLILCKSKLWISQETIAVGAPSLRVRANAKGIVDAKTNSFREFNVYAHGSSPESTTTLADRSFRIMLIRKGGDEHLERFSPKQQGNQLARLRGDLHLTALQYAKEIADAYDRAAQFHFPSKTDDRLRDILEPLFAIA
jgi:hypothetical protein